MIRVTILGLDVSSGTMITGPLDLFHLAGRLWNGIFGLKATPCFDVEIVNSDCEPVKCTGNLSILPHKRLEEIEQTDLILIPSIVDLNQTLEKRFKTATGDTPLKYLQRLRVEAGKRMMETQNLTFEQITHRVGYESSSYFRKVFTQICHITPKAYRQKWGPPNTMLTT